MNNNGNIIAIGAGLNDGNGTESGHACPDSVPFPSFNPAPIAIMLPLLFKEIFHPL